LNLAYVAAETLQKIILDSDESKDWIRWIKDSFAFSGDSAHGLTYAWRKGRCLFLRENLSFLLAADGSTLRVSAKDLREQFGQWVPVAERDNGGGDKGHTDGIVSCTFPGLLFTLPRRQRPDGRREVDIVELC